jgi:DNA-binding transcriptional ArsR family regulator
MDRDTQRLFRLQAEVIQAAAHPIRLAIIDYLKDGEQCVCDIAVHIGAQRSNVSRHLNLMLKSGVLELRKDGLRAMYRLRTPCIVKFINCVTQVVKERHKSEMAALRKL